MQVVNERLKAEVAKELKLSERQVNAVIGSFYAYLRRKLVSFEDKRIFVDEIGEIGFRPKMGERAIDEKIIQRDRYSKCGNPKAAERIDILIERLKKNVKEVRDEFEEKVEFKKMQRGEYYKDMEK